MIEVERFPYSDDFSDIGSDGLNLAAINVKTHAGELLGIQMYFENRANGSTYSPLFQSDASIADQISITTIEIPREVRYVSMGMIGGFKYTGIRLLD